MKRILGLLIVVLLVLAGCRIDQGAVDPVMMDEPDIPVQIEEGEVPLSDGIDKQVDNGMMMLTLEELAAYNGMNGMPAYVAFDGMIYDVTDHPQWTTGEHGGNMAGTDITEMLKAAPHGVSKLEELKKVGTIKTGAEGQTGATADMMQLTLNELAAYNGMNGMPAYVAVEGKIYDVTDHPQWTSGEHGGNMAGTDITEMLKAAPHGMGKLEETMWVGLVIDEMGMPVASVGTVGMHEMDDDDELELTLAELAAYNGMNGMPAYVAVDGKIYDVTGHPQWTSGEHGGNMAGTDITEMLKAAPHGMSKLDELEEVGELDD